MRVKEYIKSHTQVSLTITFYQQTSLNKNFLAVREIQQVMISSIAATSYVL